MGKGSNTGSSGPSCTGPSLPREGVGGGVGVGFARPSMPVVPQQPPKTAFTTLANLSVQGLVLGLIIGLETEFLSVPEQKRLRPIQTNALSWWSSC